MRQRRAADDAARTLDAFAVRLRDEVEPDALRGELLGVTNSRNRTANVLERQQLKWPYGWVALWLAPYAVITPALFSDAIGVTVDPFLPYLGAAVGFSIVPVAIGIAILRHRLYEIDMLIKRTVVYATTGAAGAARFLAIAASTVVSFGLFQPIRRRIHDAVNRRFDRSLHATLWLRE